mmetsp:Transcript_7209/g.21158  ORF Transcript_7209/g.21158 Transcript_7209/m.21158 type:complete len:673 (-) Transcript_7209:1156-3174(-)
MRGSLTRLLAVAATAAAFKQLANFKMPSVGDMQRDMAAKAKFGDKKLVVVTGTSSGLGRKTARALLRTGKYHVVGAVRDLDKMEVVADIEDFDPELFTPMECELNSFESVRTFHANLDEWRLGKPVDRLICNAGVYQPSLPYAKWSADGHEQTMQINYLSHFLLASLVMPDMVRAADPRVVLVGSVTGNDNTVGGGGVYPIADLKDLEGLKAGAKNPVSMFDGYNFDGAKAYKDSKLCLMMLSNMLHDKYHKQTGISFSSIYPGCIAESPLFREKRPWFRKYFPVFMKYITGGFVGEEEAGLRLFQVAHDPRCAKSGVYWSWNGGPREGRGAEALEKGGQIQGGGGAGGGASAGAAETRFTLNNGFGAAPPAFRANLGTPPPALASSMRWKRPSSLLKRAFSSARLRSCSRSSCSPAWFTASTAPRVARTNSATSGSDDRSRASEMAFSPRRSRSSSRSPKPPSWTWWPTSPSVRSHSSRSVIARRRSASLSARASAASTASVAAATAARTGSGSGDWSAFCAAKIASRAATTASETARMPWMMNCSTGITARRSDAPSKAAWNSRRASSSRRCFSSKRAESASASRTAPNAASSRARRASCVSTCCVAAATLRIDAIVPARRNECGPWEPESARTPWSHADATVSSSARHAPSCASAPPQALPRPSASRGA